MTLTSTSRKWKPRSSMVSVATSVTSSPWPWSIRVSTPRQRTGKLDPLHPATRPRDDANRGKAYEAHRSAASSDGRRRAEAPPTSGLRDRGENYAKWIFSVWDIPQPLPYPTSREGDFCESRRYQWLARLPYREVERNPLGDGDSYLRNFTLTPKT